MSQNKVCNDDQSTVTCHYCENSQINLNDLCDNKSSVTNEREK